MNADERVQALKAMSAASTEFYRQAVYCGVHAFIEFAGLMNEYIKMCEEAHARGIDFSTCNTHGEHELPAEQYHIDYLAEKLDCILGSRVKIKAVRPRRGRRSSSNTVNSHS
jgi:hypothetical protein